ncbi:HAD-superfamily hydrolase, subfamily IA, variant 1 [Thermodesulfatator indicus DSM 15286]|uniref:phosphoglycolate phosphatase n=1 Tax=Thermodesulfatator indicus (strain DSM 15286 / JCM 11887 / CIR29812) TaxID=667014 RepID=F8ADD9_THEID|nr:HAD-IA family hydrolase [Thermodesulfatator indicus]AEH45954.1 HAD-superfamily hydrolase, subfamily IA, variant 1 [Thermodesulfatator indicus DSM 15286]
MPSCKAILFDLDGTLYYQAPLRRQMLKELLLNLLRHPISGYQELRIVQIFRQERENLRYYTPEKFSAPLEELQYILPAQKLKIPEETVKKVVQKWIYDRPLKYLKDYKISGLDEFLAACKARNIKIGVFSDYPAEKKLKAMKINHFIDLALCATDPEINAFKPSPKGLEVAMKKLGLTPKELLYIGDHSEVDGLCAQKAGVTFILISPKPKKNIKIPQIQNYKDLAHLVFEER